MAAEKSYAEYYLAIVVEILLLINLKIKSMKNLSPLNEKIKRQLKQKFAVLTDDDLFLLEGKQDEVIGRIQTKLGVIKEEFDKLISELYSIEAAKSGKIDTEVSR